MSVLIPHPHILRRILSFTDRQTLAVSLRVCSIFYDHAGAVLYRHITYNPDRGMDPFLDLSIPDKLGTTLTLKDRLLSRVRMLDIREHDGACHGLDDVGSKMPDIQTVRFCGPNLRSICTKHDGPCLITTSLSPKTVVFIYSLPPLRDPSTDLTRLFRNVTRVVLLLSSSSSWFSSLSRPLYKTFPDTIKEIVVIFESYRDVGLGPGWLGDKDGYTDSSKVRQLANMVLYDTRKRYDFVNAGWIVHPDMPPKATIAQVQQRAERDLRDEVMRVGKGDKVRKALEAMRFMSGEQYVDQGTWAAEFTEKELDNWLWVKIDR